MTKATNTDLLKAILKALYAVTGRRTTGKLADDTIGSILKTLEERFPFLKDVSMSEQEYTGGQITFDVATSLDTIDRSQLKDAIEAIIRFVYTDLSEEAGLYFITELKEHVGVRMLKEIQNYDIDLDQLQLEQHYYFRRLERKKARIQANKAKSSETEQSSPNLLGYTWKQVSSWKHEPGSQYCVLYNEKGDVLDRLNLDRVIQSYVDRLSGYTDASPAEYEQALQIYEKEYQLLELMHSRDMDVETAAELLHISQEKLNAIIQKLLQMEVIHYTSYDTVELTGTGIDFLSEKKIEKK